MSNEEAIFRIEVNGNEIGLKGLTQGESTEFEYHGSTVKVECKAIVDNAGNV